MTKTGPKLSDTSDGFGMLGVEEDGIALRLYWGMARQVWRLTTMRAGFIWKVLRGQHTLIDAMHDLAAGRAARDFWAVVKAGNRLRLLQIHGGSAADVDVLRIAFRATTQAFNERVAMNDFYQDSNPYVGTRIRYRRQPSETAHD